MVITSALFRPSDWLILGHVIPWELFDRFFERFLADFFERFLPDRLFGEVLTSNRLFDEPLTDFFEVVFSFSTRPFDFLTF